MQQSIDLPLTHALPEHVSWRFSRGHLVVVGEKIPDDRLADPQSRRAEWFEHRIPVRWGCLGLVVRLINPPDGPHLLVAQLSP